MWRYHPPVLHGLRAGAPTSYIIYLFASKCDDINTLRVFSSRDFGDTQCLLNTWDAAGVSSSCDRCLRSSTPYTTEKRRLRLNTTRYRISRRRFFRCIRQKQRERRRSSSSSRTAALNHKLPDIIPGKHYHLPRDSLSEKGGNKNKKQCDFFQGD